MRRDAETRSPPPRSGVADFDYLAHRHARRRATRPCRGDSRIDAAARALDRGDCYVVRLEPRRTAASPRLARCFGLTARRARKMIGQAADAVHAPARHAQPRLAARGIAAHDHPPDRAGERPRRSSTQVHAGVVEGRRLADAMAREPKSFPPLYRAMVAAGESSGTLPTILDRLAALLERQAEIRGKMMTALAYPAILAVVAIGVVTALMMFVVPQVVEQFDTVGQQLPLLTRIVIGVSDFLVGWWWAMLLCAMVVGFGAWRALTRAVDPARVRQLAPAPAAARPADPRSARRAHGADAVDDGREPPAAARRADADRRHDPQPPPARRLGRASSMRSAAAAACRRRCAAPASSRRC